MASTKPKEYPFPLNTLILGGLAILLVGFGAGYYTQKIQGLQSDAGIPCQSQNHDVEIYAAHLANVLRKGGKITPMQMNVLLDVIEIRDECEKTWQQNLLLAYK